MACVRPNQVQLYADGAASGSPVTCNTAADNWVYTWSGLAEKANKAKAIEYGVEVEPAKWLYARPAK